MVADVTARDRDGELIAVPTEWDEAEHGPAPKIRMRIPRRPRPNEVAGVGDRACCGSRTAATRTIRSTTPGASSSSSTAPSSACSAFSARRRAAAGGSSRSTRSSSAASSRSPPAPARTRATATWSRSRWRRARSGYGLASARVTEKLGSLTTERAVSLIAIHAHSIPHVFPAAAVAEAEAAKPARLAGREDWRELPLVTIDPADAKDHDDAVHATRDRRSQKCRRLRHQRRHRRRRPLRAARLGARPRGAGARQFGLFPRPGRADAAGAHLQRSVLAPARRGSRRARGAPRGRRRRPQALAQLPSRAHALGREAQLRAGAGRGRRLAR